MPLKCGFVMSHITICSSCLQQILQSIVKANQGISFLGHANITKQVFDANKETFWHSLFDIDSHETTNHKFAYELLTNRYSVTIHMQNPKREQPDDSQLICEDDYKCLVGADLAVINLLMARSNTEEFVQISTAEYRHMAQMRKQLQWNENIKKHNPAYAQYIKDMSSFAITNEEAYKTALSHVLTQCDELFPLCANKAFRKWRFKTYVNSRVSSTKLRK
ncbi:hypothetical protein ACHAW6_007696 [Cyclotella cf. meneghiniana]